MTETIEIAAETRTLVGKSSKALGAQGKLPAVVYGPAIESVSLAIDKHGFEQILIHSGIGSTIFHLSIDGAKPINVMVKDLKHDVLKGTVEHVDFWAINMKTTVVTSVPVHYLGSAEGEKTGGVMVHELREISIEALPGDLPDSIEIDVTPLEVGHALHVSDLVAPKGVTILDDPEAIVCAVMAPAKEEEETVTEEITEPELVGKDTEEEA
ncbi:MAG: 50S ribosomal protein L25 [Actinobacteria bacterium HGW-Actinobacteria-1]|jgi:large subunit ribosomal protein L25|nr:MAG: 50S ribosomal protein L25 [Actinobacteria bacterium HGW-Actinobacteria-1]